MTQRFHRCVKHKKKKRTGKMRKILCAVVAVIGMFIIPAMADETCDGTVVNYVSATGTVSQSGTPTPTNPVEPVF